MTRSKRIPALLLLAAAIVLPGSRSAVAQENGSPGVARGAEEASLVPAAMGIRTDQQGNSWNVEQNGTLGRIGSTMVNSGLALSINEEKFVSFQPMMTSDGSEFVLHGRPLEAAPGLQVQRRILLMNEVGALRYAEMFYNGSADPIRFTVGLATNFSGNYKTFLTDRGRTEPVLLKERESGIVVLPGATQSTRAFLFTLADERSELRPTISAQNRYGLTFRYAVSLEPGETGILVHHVSQVVIPQSFDRRALARLFGSYSFAQNEDAIPSEWRDYLQNAGETARNPGQADLKNRGFGVLGIEPGARDILAIGERTRLTGTASGGSIQVAARYGTAEIAWEDVLAIAGRNNNPGREPRVFLRDGQILSADLSVPEFRFEQGGGGKLELDMNTLDRLVLAKGEDSINWASGALGMIETYRGDRIRIEGADSLSVQGLTPWGTLAIPLDQLIWLGPVPGDNSGQWVELENGIRCLVFLEDGEIELRNETLGDIRVPSIEVRSVFTPRILQRNRWNSEVGIRTSIDVIGHQRLVGDIGNTALPVISEGVTIETATSDIRRIVRVGDVSMSPGGLPEETPSFEIERWDGGVISGFIDLEAISLKVGSENWNIPLVDIERIETPSPELTPEVLATIQQWIDNLGSDDWGTRERATRELGAFGYLARPVLKQELRTSRDPEVSHRLERILADLD